MAFKVSHVFSLSSSESYLPLQTLLILFWDLNHFTRLAGRKSDGIFAQVRTNAKEKAPISIE